MVGNRPAGSGIRLAVSFDGAVSMRVQELQPNWAVLKVHAKARWRKLTEEDLDEIQGNPERLVRLLQERYGYPRGLVLMELGHFLETERTH
jgi:hypothetical protein